MAEHDHDAARARDAERLRELEARLGKKAGAKLPSRGEEHFSQANLAWRMVTELVAGLGIGFMIGYGLDYLTGLRPVFMVVHVVAVPSRSTCMCSSPERWKRAISSHSESDISSTFAITSRLLQLALSVIPLCFSFAFEMRYDSSL